MELLDFFSIIWANRNVSLPAAMLVYPIPITLLCICVIGLIEERSR